MKRVKTLFFSHSYEMPILRIKRWVPLLLLYYQFLRKVLYILHSLFLHSFTEIKLEIGKKVGNYLNSKKCSKTSSKTSGMSTALYSESSVEDDRVTCFGEPSKVRSEEMR